MHLWELPQTQGSLKSVQKLQIFHLDNSNIKTRQTVYDYYWKLWDPGLPDPAGSGRKTRSGLIVQWEQGHGVVLHDPGEGYQEPTGCPKKNALLSLKAYNSGLEGAVGTSRDSFGILRLWAFIWDQEVQDYVKASLRKLHQKLATLSQKTVKI